MIEIKSDMNMLFGKCVVYIHNYLLDKAFIQYLTFIAVSSANIWPMTNEKDDVRLDSIDTTEDKELKIGGSEKSVRNRLFT